MTQRAGHQEGRRTFAVEHPAVMLSEACRHQVAEDVACEPHRLRGGEEDVGRLTREKKGPESRNNPQAVPRGAQMISPTGVGW